MYCLLWLTCKDAHEADKVKNALLVKHLVACVKQWPVQADFHWQGKLEHSNEIMLCMESRLDLFDQVEAEVKKLHSYETFVLEATPLEKVSKNATTWLKKELKNV